MFVMGHIWSPGFGFASVSMIYQCVCLNMFVLVWYLTTTN